MNWVGWLSQSKSRIRARGWSWWGIYCSRYRLDGYSCWLLQYGLCYWRIWIGSEAQLRMVLVQPPFSRCCWDVRLKCEHWGHIGSIGHSGVLWSRCWFQYTGELHINSTPTPRVFYWRAVDWWWCPQAGSVLLKHHWWALWIVEPRWCFSWRVCSQRCRAFLWVSGRGAHGCFGFCTAGSDIA